MTSTPARKSSSAIFGVIPRPPAAFSPLTTTNVGWWRSRSAGSSPRSVRLPSDPTMSPTNRIFAGAVGTSHTLTEGMAEPDDIPPAPPPAPAPGAPVVVPRWVQLVMLPLGVLALYAIAQAAGIVLLLFIVAGVIALILNPVVEFVQRAHL